MRKWLQTRRRQVPAVGYFVLSGCLGARGAVGLRISGEQAAEQFGDFVNWHGNPSIGARNCLGCGRARRRGRKSETFKTLREPGRQLSGQAHAVAEWSALSP
jgi:hypothetical protein